jgi:DNA-binding GntR family transcriptional regulator
VATLRNQIVSGAIPAGTRLIQQAIATELGVSTTPVREALRELAAEGLVELDRNRGAAVAEVSAGDLLEVIMLRRQLEPLCMRISAEKITEDELREAESLCDAMEKEKNLGTWADLNRQFHKVVCSASRSPRLITLLRQLRAANAVYVGLGLRAVDGPTAHGNRDHRDLVAALRDRDAERAANISERHISRYEAVVTDMKV